MNRQDQIELLKRLLDHVDTVLQLRRSSNDLPAVGEIVRIAVVGAAHVFELSDT